MYDKSGESSSIVMTEESWSKFMGGSCLWDFSLVGKGDRGDEVFVINFGERRVRGNAKPPTNFIDMIVRLDMIISTRKNRIGKRRSRKKQVSSRTSSIHEILRYLFNEKGAAHAVH